MQNDIKSTRELKLQNSTRRRKFAIHIIVIAKWRMRINSIKRIYCSLNKKIWQFKFAFFCFLLSYVIDHCDDKTLWYWLILKIKVHSTSRKIRIQFYYYTSHRFMIEIERTISCNIKIDISNVIQNYTIIKTNWAMCWVQTKRIFARMIITLFCFETLSNANLNIFYSKLTSRLSQSFEMFCLLS